VSPAITAWRLSIHSTTSLGSLPGPRRSRRRRPPRTLPHSVVSEIAARERSDLAPCVSEPRGLFDRFVPTSRLKEAVMYAVVRSYSGQGASELFEQLEQRNEEVKDLIGGVPGFVSYTAFRSGEGGLTVTVCHSDPKGHDTARDVLSPSANSSEIGTVARITPRIPRSMMPGSFRAGRTPTRGCPGQQEVNTRTALGCSRRRGTPSAPPGQDGRRAEGGLSSPKLRFSGVRERYEAA
jgi:hypothetical protein